MRSVAGRHNPSWPGAPSELLLGRRPRRRRRAGGGHGRRAGRGRRGARGVGTRGGGAAPRRRAGIPGPRCPRPPRPPQSRLPPRVCLSAHLPPPPGAGPNSARLARLTSPASPPLEPELEPPVRPRLPFSAPPRGGSTRRARLCLARATRGGPRQPLAYPQLVRVSTSGKARERPWDPIGPPGASDWCCHGNRMACKAVRSSFSVTGASSGRGELLWGRGVSAGAFRGRMERG